MGQGQHFALGYSVHDALQEPRTCATRANRTEYFWNKNNPLIYRSHDYYRVCKAAHEHTHAGEPGVLDVSRRAPGPVRARQHDRGIANNSSKNSKEQIERIGYYFLSKSFVLFFTMAPKKNVHNIELLEAPR